MILRVLLLFLVPLAVFAAEEDRLKSFFDSYKNVSEITYNFTRKVTSGKDLSFFKGNVTLKPFENFKINFFYPENEVYEFKDGKLAITLDGRETGGETVAAKDYAGLRPTLMLTNFFLYCLSEPSNYKPYKQTAESLVYIYQPNSRQKELLYIDRKTGLPARITTDFLGSKIKVVFSGYKKIENLEIPMKISTNVSSKEELSKNVSEEMTISEIKVKINP